MGFAPWMLGGPSGATSGWDDGPARPEGVGQQQQQQRPPNAPKGQVRVPVFRGGHEGFGDARRLPQKRQNSYSRVSANADLRWPGELREWGYVGAQVVNHKEPPIFITEWTDTALNPIILYVADNVIMKIKAGAVTTDTTLAATATGAAMHDNGSGVPYLYVAEGGTSTNKVQRRDRAGALTTATNLYADKLLSLAGNLYITAIPPAYTGGVPNGIGVVTVGTDPNVTAQPALTVIGNPAWPINNLCAVRYAPIALKPDGIYAYDRLSDTWLNHAEWMRFLPHEDNGKVFWYEGTDVCIALGTGGAVRFNGFVAIPYDPLPLEDTTPDSDTTPQLIGAAGTARHWGVLVTKVGAKRQRVGGHTNPTNTAIVQVPVVLKSTDGGSTFTDYSTQAFDGDPTTYVDLSAFPQAPSGYLYIGNMQPFIGVRMGVLAANANAATWSVDVWTGSAWAVLGTMGAKDLTLGAGATATLQRSGWWILPSDPVAKGWKQNTLNGKTAFWTRFYATGALSASVQVNAVEFLPWRPSLDAANFASDGYDRAGCYPHLLFSRTQGDGAHVVHDMGALAGGATDEIGAVIYARVGGPSLNDDRQLVFAGKLSVWWTDMSLDDRPAAFAWPNQSGDTLVELPSLDLGVTAKLNALELDGFDFRRIGYIYYRFEDGRPWTLAGEFRNLPVRIEVPSSDRVGDLLRIAVGWTAGMNEGFLPVAPRLTRIDAFLTPMPGLVAPRLPRVSLIPVV